VTLPSGGKIRITLPDELTPARLLSRPWDARCRCVGTNASN
jgi:hypothetical protein